MKKINYEDLETIARYSNINTQLISEFENYFNEISDNFNLLAGYIFSGEELTKMNYESRPTHKVPLMTPIFLRILGSFKGNIPGLEFLGKTPDDQAKAGLFQELNNYIFYQANNVEYELAKAFLFAITARITWLRQDFCYNRDSEDGTIEIEHYHPFLKFDTAGSRRDLSDCQYIFDDNWLTPDEIIRRYAKKDEDLAALLRERFDEIMGGKFAKMKDRIYNYLSKLSGMILSYDGESKGYDEKRIWSKEGLVYDKTGLWMNNGRFRVSDVYYRHDFPKLYITDKIMRKRFDFTDEVKKEDLDEIELSNEKEWIDSEKLQIIKSMLPDPLPYIQVDRESKVVQTSFCSGIQVKLFEGLQQIQNGNYKFTRLDCYDFHPDVLETKSIADNIKDAVKSYNLRDHSNLIYLMRSTMLEWWAEEQYKGKLGDLAKNKIGGVRIVPQGAIQNNAIKRIDQPNQNIAIERHLEQKWEEIKKLTGVNDNALSRQETSGESGKLFQSRVQQTEIMQEWISENAHSVLPILAKNNIYLLQKYFTDEKVFRIIGENGDINWLSINQKDEYGKIKNDISVGEFDIIISKVPFGTIAREADKERNMELLGVTSKIPNMEIVNMLLIEQIIKQTTLQNKAKVSEVINILVQKQLELLTQAGQPTEEEKINLALQQLMAQLKANQLKISNEQEQIQNEGMALDNQKKKIELEKIKKGLGEIINLLNTAAGNNNGNGKMKEKINV